MNEMTQARPIRAKHLPSSPTVVIKTQRHPWLPLRGRTALLQSPNFLKFAPIVSIWPLWGPYRRLVSTRAIYVCVDFDLQYMADATVVARYETCACECG